MPLGQKDAIDLIRGTLFPAFKKERDRLDRIDRWYRWDHDKPFQPRAANKEYKELSDRAQTPWLGLIVTSVAQALYIDGYRQEGAKENAEQPWYWWQLNGMDSRQIAIHRAALAYGYSFASCLPGTDMFDEKAPVIRGISPRRMITFYNEPEYDDWARFALRCDSAKVKGDSKGWALKLYDDESVYYLNANASGDEIEWISRDEHNLGVCPVVRFANQLDLEGRTPGEVEPFIPLAARIDQTSFDRLIVQRYASWVVRTIAGMAKPNSDAEAAAKKLLLRIEDVLVAEDKDTKFGSLPATPLEGFISAIEADIRQLAAVSQTPAHEMLGQMANLSAEALAAARASLTAKVEERQYSFGESHEQLFRLASHVMGDRDGAKDFGAQVKWRDTSIRSLAQASDALGKLAQMLGVPVEVLWQKIPGFTQQDIDEAKAIIEKGDSLVNLTALLDRQIAENVAYAALAMQHRRAQLALRAASIKDLIKLYPAFDLSNIRGTWDALEEALVIAINARGRTSSGLSVAFYEKARRAAAAKGAATPRVGAVAIDEIVEGLRVVGPANAGLQLAKGRAIADVSKTTLVNLSGEVSRHVLNFGRRSLVESINADRRALGWQRVTSGDACDFCSMLAGRGTVYKEETVYFEAHRHCACSGEPIFQ